MMQGPVLFLALSQQLPDTMPVDFGTRVRVVAAVSRQPIVGRIVANDSGRVVVVATEKGSRVSVPLNAVTELRWSRGRAQKRWAFVGAGVGLLAGAAAYSMAAKPGPGDDPFDVIFLPLLAFWAAPGVGALVGSLSAPERWAPVSLPTTRTSSGSQLVALQLAPTERIRVATRSARFVGRPEHHTRDTLTLVTSNGTIPLPWVDVIDVRAGGGRNRWVGALRGAAVGLVVSEIAEASSPTGSTALERISVGIPGAVLGAVALSPRRWKSLPLPGR